MQTPQGGVFTLTTSGSYTYLPPNDIVGNEVEERFPYTITDRDNESDSATLTITVKRIIEDEDPIANPDIINISIPASSDVVTGNVLDNDEGNGLKVIPISIEPTDKNGTFNLIADGSYSYTPPQTIAPLMMDTEVFSYTAIDSRDATDGSTLTINISDDPDDLPPFCRPDDNQSTAGKEAVTGDVAKNDDTGTPPIRITREDSLGVSKPIKGTLELNEDGSYTYTPPSTIVDIDSDIFFYKLTDSNGKSCESSLEIRINPDDDDKKPLARPDTNQVRDTLSGGVQVAGNLLLEDVPGDGSSDDLGDGLETITIENTTGSLGGRVELNRVDGSYTYFSPGGGVEGDDMFKYTITDIDGDPSGSTLTIAVTIDFNLPPTVEAGINQTIVLQQNNTNATLNGTVTDDGLPNPPSAVTSTWSQISGPVTAIITDPAAEDTTVQFSEVGVYIFKLIGSDSELNADDEVTITVNQNINQPPTVEAGTNQTIVLQNNTNATLNGTVTDDGLPNPPSAVTSTWSQMSGPDTAIITDPAAEDTSVQFSDVGVYTFELKGDDSKLNAVDEVTVTVVPIDPPIAEAGQDQPQTGQQLNVGQTVTLDGSASRDAAGNPVASYEWSFDPQSPNTAELREATTATPNFTPTVPGDYVVSLTVTDAQGLDSAPDIVNIRVADDCSVLALRNLDLTITLSDEDEIPGNVLNGTSCEGNEDITVNESSASFSGLGSITVNTNGNYTISQKNRSFSTGDGKILVTITDNRNSDEKTVEIRIKFRP
jgi:hypothetical protein